MPLWEDLKATVRGNIISFKTNLKKQKYKEMGKFEARVLALESKQLECLGLTTLRDLGHTQALLKQTQTDKARQTWQATRSHIYQWGDKSSKTLHWLCSRN